MHTATIASQMLVRELRALQREIMLFPDDASVWATLPGVTNSAGNLALHVAGGLRHCVGSVLGEIPYARDREAEFATRTGTREDLVAALGAAQDTVEKALRDRDLAGELPEPIGGRRYDAVALVMHLCVHAGFHLGQVGYLRRMLTGDSRTSGALPLQDVALPL